LWLLLFLFFIFLYLILFLLNFSNLTNIIALTQLFLAIFILFSYLYPFYKAKSKLNRIEGESYYFVSYLYLLTNSGLNFSNIFSFIISLNEKTKFPTIKKELHKIFKISKISGKSLRNTILTFFSNYPNCEFKKVMLELSNIEGEKGEIKKYVETFYKNLNKKKGQEEKKFYHKLDVIIAFYLIFLLIFPFFLILLLFIFDVVDFMMVSLSNTTTTNNSFLKILFILLIVLPIIYILLYLVIDYLQPSHIKVEREKE
jgi:archaellum biogenesis protein FlaJ (TadC family)